MSLWPIFSIFLACLVAICGWGLKRYVDTNDKRIDDAFKANEKTLKKVDEVADQLKASVASFHNLLHSEKEKLADEVKLIREFTNSTKQEIFKLIKEIKESKDAVDGQQKNISDLVKLSLKHEKQIKTLIEQVGPDTVIVKQKR